MSENTNRVSARTRKKRRLRAEEEQLALEIAEAERLSQFRAGDAIVDISSSSRTRTRAQHESQEQDLRRRREIVLHMLDDETQSVDVEAPTEAVQEIAIADHDDSDDEFVPLGTQGTQSTDLGTQSQQTFPILMSAFRLKAGGRRKSTSWMYRTTMLRPRDRPFPTRSPQILKRRAV